MFWRITGKLLLKAMLPFLILIGILNYTLYMRGGDPTAMWKGVSQNMVTSIKSGVSGTLSSISDVKGDLQDIGAPPSATKVYSWKDQRGMTHFSTSKPIGVEAETQSYDPNANVVKRFVAPEKPKPEPIVKTAEASAPVPAASGLNIPEGLPEIPGLELKQLDEILKARQEMLDKL